MFLIGGVQAWLADDDLMARGQAPEAHALPESCLSWPPTQAGRPEPRTTLGYAGGTPSTLWGSREAQESAETHAGSAGVDSTSADQCEPNRAPAYPPCATALPPPANTPSPARAASTSTAISMASIVTSAHPLHDSALAMRSPMECGRVSLSCRPSPETKHRTTTDDSGKITSRSLHSRAKRGTSL